MRLFPCLHYFQLLFFLLLNCVCYSQLPYGLKNGISSQPYCSRCQQTIAEKPPEVLFGIFIKSNGDVYFSMDNKEWFEKIFRLPTYGITVDIVSKERYKCNLSRNNETDFIRGQLLQPVYKPALIEGNEELRPGTMYVKIGKVPANLLNKELEGNLVILNGNMICYYTNFVNIDRSVWQLLPMGLFTDTLMQIAASGTNEEKESFTYSKKLQFSIPFQKNKITYNKDDIKPLYDSLKLTDYSIRKIEMRAYSSVEGSQKINEQLMEGRAQSLLSALKQYQPSMNRTTIINAENWLEFFRDIEGTKFNDLMGLSKLSIKQKLSDKALADEIEPLLAKQRKAVITLYLETTNNFKTSTNTIIESFNKAIEQKNISLARVIQKELVDEINDNKIPLDYINKLEIPASKEFSSLLNDREVYRYLLKATSEYEALQNFLELKEIDPDNGKINYNICALRFFTWQFGNDSTVRTFLLNDIKTLASQGIDESLIKRMLINYHILKCDEYNLAFKYDEKDSALNFIRETYKMILLNDEDIYSLARYFTYYSQSDWAQEIIKPRIDQIDVSEDLVFYYLNLLFFDYAQYDSDDFHKAILNAINLNRQRYCNFFLPNDKGGASMQLLEYEMLKLLYCENCKK